MASHCVVIQFQYVLYNHKEPKLCVSRHWYSVLDPHYPVGVIHSTSTITKHTLVVTLQDHKIAIKEKHARQVETLCIICSSATTNNDLQLSV